MKSLLVVVFTGWSCVGLAQPRIELKAYSQVFTPGMIRQRETPVANRDSIVKQSLENIQYWIYAITAHGARPAFRQLWIRGQWYKIKNSTILTPLQQTGDPQNRMHIPVTDRQLIQIEPGEKLQQSPVLFPALRQMMKHSQLLVSYSWKGKMYYRSLSNIMELEKVYGE